MSPRRPKRRGRFEKIISMILGVGGLFTALGLLAIRNQLGGSFPYHLIVILAFSLFCWSAYVYRDGKRITALTADEVISQDQRAPVVYLRSFEDDPIVANDTQALMRHPVLPSSVKNQEESLASVLNEIGPCVAIGRPGEQLPTLGMARKYIAGDDWHGVVQDLVMRASAVVIRAGFTDGLWWEIETVIKDVKPEHLLFILPYGPQLQDTGPVFSSRESPPAYQVFQKRLEGFIPCKLPPFYPARNEGNFTGILFFDPDWTPHLGRVSNGFHWTMEGRLRATLAPFMRKFRIRN
jgi:hypothetical protein